MPTAKRNTQKETTKKGVRNRTKPKTQKQQPRTQQQQNNIPKDQQRVPLFSFRFWGLEYIKTELSIATIKMPYTQVVLGLKIKWQSSTFKCTLIAVHKQLEFICTELAA